ncbi:MAG TPA: type I secretion system permease/ATPase [Caulobacteraceae bacterium]|nr:type I secretion system permease/ATPase [Caulobacteraceae bacterium]
MLTWTSLTRNVPAALRAAVASCRRHFAYAAGFSAIINLLYIAPTLYMLQVYDRVVPSHGAVTLVFLTVLLLATLATLALLEMVRSRLLVRASLRLDRELSVQILTIALNRRLGSKAPQVMRDFDTFRQAVTGSGILALFDAPWMVVYVALCFVLHPVLGFMAIGGAACLAALSVATERATRPRLDDASKAAAASYASLSEATQAGDVIQSLGMRDAVIRRNLAERSNMTGLQGQASLSAGRLMGLTKFIRLSLQSLSLGVAAWLAVGQQIAPGAIFAASLLMARALAPLEMVLGSWRSLVEARNAFQNLCEALGGAEAAAAAPKTILPAPVGRLDVEQLTVLGPYPDRPILQGVSFSVAPGEVLGLVGPSGAGKTTLVRALVGAVSASQGNVRIDSASLTDWDAERLGRHLGYLPQELGLMRGTVKQNICRFADVTHGSRVEIDEKAVAAAQACGAHEMILRLPAGYDTPIEWGGAGLSLGQAQRVALARALYDEPSLVILDEPNAHLDGEGELKLLQALDQVKQRGAAVVLVAHRATLLPVIDSLLVLKDGRVTHHGARDEVLGQINRSQQETQKLTREAQAA